MVGGSVRVMKKTSIYLDDELDVALSRRAAAEGTTKAELIRRTLRDATRGAGPVRPRAVGVFTGPPDLARKADAYLAETGFGET